MKRFLMFAFGIVSLWDGFTTLVGTNLYLNPNNVIFSILVAIVILSFMIATKYVWEQKETFGIIIKILWLIALGYDILTSYMGNLKYVLGGSGSGDKLAFLVGITILTCASPILVSILYDDI